MKYVPAQCQEGGDFNGYVLVKVPSFDERYELLDQMGLKTDPQTGNISAGDMGSFQAIRKLVSASLKYYLEVKLAHNDGRVFASKDDLLLEPDCDAILIDVAMAVSRGFKPGKN